MIQNPLAASMVQKPMQSVALNMSPQLALPEPPKNALMQAIGGGLNAFRKSFDPDGYKADKDEAKAAEGEKLKQTLALMQQQRALPEQQRGQWWQQNAPTISKIIGQDVSQMPLDVTKFSDQALDGQIAALSAQMGIGPAAPEPMTAYQAEQIRLREQELASGKPEGPEIRQVGNQIVERQPDGSWKSVYEGSTPAETARVFQGVIDRKTGEQKLIMNNGTIIGTGVEAYVAPQIMSFGGVPVSVDRRTGESSELAPLSDVAGNKAALASAEVQGKAQGQAAFDLPGIEFRSQTAINSIDDLKKRNIGQRFGMQGKLYAIPGTEGADIQSLVSQVVSQAFLNAFDQLRGAGAITQTEGEAATAAITRLKDQNISVAEALKAMDELQSYYRKGIQVAREKATKAPVLPQRPVAGQAPAPMQTPAPPKSWVTKQAERFQSLAPKPAAQVPEGVDPEDWKYMTDEQKALFQ